MPEPKRTSEDFSEEIASLMSEQRSLQLSTLTEEGPQASYTPYIYRAESHSFLVLISALAPHTAALQSHPACGVMIIEDESKAKNLFARTRLTASCHASEWQGSREERLTVLAEMEDRLGGTIKLLSQLGDFRLVQLKVSHARFVKGFGAAYELETGSFRYGKLLSR